MQRLPHIVGDQRARELTYTGRDFSGVDAVKYGLALEGFESKTEMDDHVLKLAEGIASKSPLTIRGIKKTAIFARDHNVQDSLNQVAAHNSAFLYSDDLNAAFQSMVNKKMPVFKGD
jgi:enoyl-CoA hydratase